MKPKSSVLLPLMAAFAALLLAGCAGIEGVPYQPGTPAARIYENNCSTTNSAQRASTLITVPVVAGDAEAARYLEFSDVQVDVEQKGAEKTVKVYAHLLRKQIVWRVARMREGKEIYHFNTSSRMDYDNEVIPLEPLALDPNLPVPDNIVVTLVKGGRE